MSVILLRKSLSTQQWFGLVLLFFGVIMVNMDNVNGGKNTSANTTEGNTFIGLGSLVIASLTSAFSGVYFEKLLKKDKFDLIISNIQLSMVGVILSTFSIFLNNYDIVSVHGFFYGFNKFVWAYISLLAFGGLVVSLVMKYADNILKGFSTSIAIILSSILSYFLFSFQFTFLFTLGASMVIFSVVVYSFGYKKP